GHADLVEDRELRDVDVPLRDFVELDAGDVLRECLSEFQMSLPCVRALRARTRGERAVRVGEGRLRRETVEGFPLFVGGEARAEGERRPLLEILPLVDLFGDLFEEGLRAAIYRHDALSDEGLLHRR